MAWRHDREGRVSSSTEGESVYTAGNPIKRKVVVEPAALRALHRSVDRAIQQ
jgi:hypothetical protein